MKDTRLVSPSSRSLLPSKADLLGFGMGETTVLEIARRLDAGESIHALRDMRGVAYLLGRSEELSEGKPRWQSTRVLPSFEEANLRPWQSASQRTLGVHKNDQVSLLFLLEFLDYLRALLWDHLLDLLHQQKGIALKANG